MAVEQDADAEPEKINFVTVIAQSEIGDVREIVVDGDTEFCFIAKNGSHETNPRLSMGLKVLAKLKCGGLRLLSPLLDVNSDFHVVISDHEEEIANKKLLVKTKRSKSWHRTIDGHPQNENVPRLPTKEAIERLVRLHIPVHHIAGS
jgi:hypothetical protein